MFEIIKIDYDHAYKYHNEDISSFNNDRGHDDEDYDDDDHY